MRVLLPGYLTWIVGLGVMHGIDVALTGYGLLHAPVVEASLVGAMLWQAAGMGGLIVGKVAMMLVFVVALLVARELNDIRAVRWGVRAYTAIALGIGIAVMVHNAGQIIGPAAG